MTSARLIERPSWARRRELPWLSISLIAAVGAVVGSTTWLMENGGYNQFAAIFVALGLLAISLPMLRRAARAEVDHRTARLLWIAFSCKLLGALPHYLVVFGLYDGNADAELYHSVGATLARQFRDGDFTIELGRQVQGTGFIQILTGAIYTVTGATELGGFLIYSWLGFWGLYLFHRAFVRACPQGDHHRYALLVFFLPSLLFWPSSIGKEAWMCLGLGACAYGAARILTGARFGITLVVLGTVALTAVRPHIAAIVAASLLGAYVLRKSARSSSGLAPFAKLVGIMVLGGVLLVALGELKGFLGVDAFDQESVQVTLDSVTERTGQGGSYIAGTRTDLSPTRFPQAVINVVARPFPWEVNNAQSLLASLEGLFLLGLLLLGWRRLLNALRSMLDTPYLLFCGTYTVLFVYGFSSFANYGILVRQRVQVVPFLLVIACLPPLLRDRQGSPDHRAGVPASWG